MIFAWNYQLHSFVENVKYKGLRSFVAKNQKFGFAHFLRKDITRNSCYEESYRFSLHCQLPSEKTSEKMKLKCPRKINWLLHSGSEQTAHIVLWYMNSRRFTNFWAIKNTLYKVFYTANHPVAFLS